MLAAVAERTERIRLGTMLTPLPWRRPWKVASQVATLDQLSNGRAILAVGLGAPEVSTARPTDPVDRRERAALLDDGIDVIDALWSGALTYNGPVFQLDVNRRTRSASSVRSSSRGRRSGSSGRGCARSRCSASSRVTACSRT